MKKTLITLLLFGSAVFTLTAQSIKINYKPGSVSMEELEMDSYPLDTSAAAVLLCKDTDVKVSFDSQLELRRTVTVYRRYKVLKEEGKDCADVELIYSADHSDDERIYGIKVVTYNLDKGKKVVSKMPSNLIYRDSYTADYNQVKFSAPDVRVGSVIEVQYTFTTRRYWDVGLLFIQGNYPVNHGSISVEYSEYFYFNKLTRGHHSFTEVKRDTSADTYTFRGATVRFDLFEDVFVADDVPAMKDEPYCFYPDQSRLGVEYELRSVQIPGLVYKNFSTEWSDVDNQLLEGGYLKEFTAKIPLKVEALDDEVETIKNVRASVLDAVKWDGEIGRWPSSTKAFKEKNGSAADICGIIASKLNELGYTSSPVLIKSRTRGVLASFHVSWDSFDAMILQIVTPSGKVYYTDGVRGSSYLNVLPVEYLIPNGRLLSVVSKRGSWVDLTKLVKNVDTFNVIAKLDASGTIEGECNRLFNNESSIYEKRKYAGGKDEEEFIEGLENAMKVDISEFEFPEHDAWSPRASYRFKFSTEAEVAGDYIYVKPFINKYHSERDFQDPDRRNVVEFPFPETVKYSYTLFIPSEYAVDQLPKPQAFVFDPLGSKVVVKYSMAGDSAVSVSFMFIANEMTVTAADYEVLRMYWSEICNIYNASIVLKKK